MLYEESLMKLSWSISIILIVFLLQVQSAGAQTLSQPSIFPSDTTSNEEPDPVFQALQLTPEQLQQWNDLVDVFQEPILPLFDDLTRAEQKLGELIASSSSTVSEVREQYRLVETLRQSISRLDFEYKIVLREILRPEQRPQMQEYIRNRLEQIR